MAVPVELLAAEKNRDRMDSSISTSVILDTLRELNEKVSIPLWLFGGVAVDFLVGRWTRPHSDVDLNTFAESRIALTEQLSRIGYRTSDTGWLTHWWQDGTGRGIELVFLDRTEDGSAELRIPLNASVGIPGHYPLWPGYLDLARVATLDGVSFRVGSPAGEWLGRAKTVISGRSRKPKIEHDLALLEPLIPPHELIHLRLHASVKKVVNSI
ncbi:MAG TPA: hypothetical protein VGM64_21735 [Lacunisphaera sp.]|jgi:hypothetical protein